MSRFLFRFVNDLKLRWKMLVVVLPLVTLPLFLVAGIIGYIANQQAYRGITQTSKDDLEHMARFTTDLLDAHYQQFQVYKQDKQKTIQEELATLANLAYSLVEAQQSQVLSGQADPATAKSEARRALKRVNIGETGYIYALTSKGTLAVHLAREGENIYDEKDEDGRYFIRSMCRAALASAPGEVLYIVYPWRNEILGDRFPRRKIVAYRYFPAWDWIIAVGGYLDETTEDLAFERRSFEELKSKIKSKKVGRSGYIFCVDRLGTLTVHPDSEGQMIIDATAQDGKQFIREMTVRKDGWIRYPWKAPGEAEPRMKLVRYRYFQPWDWIVAVGAYEDEFYHEANLIRGRILASMMVITLLVWLLATGMVSLAAKIFTDPINHMIGVIRQVKRGRLDHKMKVDTRDELGELAAAFNRMTEIIQHNREMEAALAQQGKMASLGILSSGVAHEINNPLGVILGYAGYLEKKIDPEDPNFKYIHEIKRESKRCKKIVQDLLSYARTPKPTLEETDINALLGQIVDFAANHTDMHHVAVVKDFCRELPPILVDPDQLRQVAINLILNAGNAMSEGGRLEVTTRLDPAGFVDIVFGDNGSGIPEDLQERIFEPFFTTKTRGTGLGLAITKQIIDMHHGRIELESTVGKGTSITVRLPVKREDYQL
ncbi:histidine kinase [Desulfuromonas versatilis]|uniref:histidine kinase n=1 Tax=Desulfuromonas versatilis TaxID=2802975 RepID=A0ABM8HZJ6_9BACT|nr:cache domain-containing protein [Desulfuromonas versatilis]BCR06030.1 histidine kinase [Desulfuromonas versatilis]